MIKKGDEVIVVAGAVNGGMKGRVISTWRETRHSSQVATVEFPELGKYYYQFHLLMTQEEKDEIHRPKEK